MNRKIHKNEVFRVLNCHLTIEETAKLCDVSLMQVKKWDSGKTIPATKRKLMELIRCTTLDHIGWTGWQFKNGILYSPMGFYFQPQQLECLAIMNTTDREKWLVRKTEYAENRRQKHTKKQTYNPKKPTEKNGV